ncbi:hypothetical protein Tco_1380199 [Tanacetum coccineum]
MDYGSPIGASDRRTSKWFSVIQRRNELPYTKPFELKKFFLHGINPTRVGHSLFDITRLHGAHRQCINAHVTIGFQLIFEGSTFGEEDSAELVDGEEKGFTKMQLDSEDSKLQEQQE